LVEEGSTSNVRRRYKKITQADLIGKTAGRWTRQEHLRFIQGKVLIQIFYFVQLLKSMARIGKKLKIFLAQGLAPRFARMPRSTSFALKTSSTARVLHSEDLMRTVSTGRKR
jgi:hypothetical protein